MNMDSREMINSIRDILVCHRNIVETNSSIVRLYNNIVNDNIENSIQYRLRTVRTQRRTREQPTERPTERPTEEINTENEQDNGMTETQISNTTTGGLFSDFANADTQRRCPISWTQFENDTPVIRINSCGHIFSPEPLREWLSRHSTCPNCRHNLIEQTPTPIGIDIMTSAAGNTAARLFADILQGSPIDTVDGLAQLAQRIERNVPNMLSGDNN